MEMEICKNTTLGIHMKATNKYNQGDVVLLEDPFMIWRIDDVIDPQFEFLEETSLAVFTGFIQQLHKNESKIQFLLNNYCFIDYDSHLDLIDCKLQSYVDISKQLSPILDTEWKTIFNVLTVPMLNGHNIEDSCGLYNHGSKFTHDCNPNCAVTSNGNQIKFTAVRDIKKGDILTCSYLSADELLMPTLLRRYSLLMKKSFICNCSRCLNPDKQRSINCECGGLRCKTSGKESFLDLEQIVELYHFEFSKNSQWICTTCHSITTDFSDLDLLHKLYLDDLNESDMILLGEFVESHASGKSWIRFKYLQIGFEVYMDTQQPDDDQMKEYCELLLQWLIVAASPTVLTNLGMGYAEYLLPLNKALSKVYIEKCLSLATYMWSNEDEDVQWMKINQ